MKLNRISSAFVVCGISISCLILFVYLYAIYDFAFLSEFVNIEVNRDKQISSIILAVFFLFGFISIWRLIKNRSTYKIYHMCIWSMVMAINTIPFIINRGWYIYMLFFYFGFVALGIIYTIYFVGSYSIRMHKILITSVFVLIVTLGVCFEYAATSRFCYSNQEYEFKLSRYEILSFVDNYALYTLRIKDNLSGNSASTTFEYLSGSDFLINRDKEERSLIIIKGTMEDSGRDWILNMKTGIFDETTVNEQSILLVASFYEHFELE